MSVFDDMVHDEQRIPFGSAARFLVELQRPTAPPCVVKTAAVQAGLLKLAAIDATGALGIQDQQGVVDSVERAALMDPNVQAALDYQQAMAEREAFAQQAQEAEQRAAAAEQQAQASAQQAQEVQAVNDQTMQQLMAESQAKQDAMMQAIQARDQSIQEQMIASQKRKEIVDSAEDMKAQLDQMRAQIEQTQAVAAENPVEALQQQQQQAMMAQATAPEAAGSAGGPAAKQEAEAQNAQAEADKQQVQAQQAVAMTPQQPELPQQGPGAPIAGAPQVPTPMGAGMPGMGGVAKTGSLRGAVLRHFGMLKAAVETCPVTGEPMRGPGKGPGRGRPHGTGPGMGRGPGKGRGREKTGELPDLIAKTGAAVKDALTEQYGKDVGTGLYRQHMPYRNGSGLHKSAVDIAEARRLGAQHGVDWSRSDFTPADLAKGMEVEKEHNVKGVDVVPKGRVPETTARIALAHLHEGGDYYDRLKKMESSMEEAKMETPAVKEAAVPSLKGMLKTAGGVEAPNPGGSTDVVTSLQCAKTQTGKDPIRTAIDALIERRQRGVRGGANPILNDAEPMQRDSDRPRFEVVKEALNWGRAARYGGGAVLGGAGGAVLSGGDPYAAATGAAVGLGGAKALDSAGSALRARAARAAEARLAKSLPHVTPGGAGSGFGRSAALTEEEAARFAAKVQAERKAKSEAERAWRLHEAATGQAGKAARPKVQPASNLRSVVERVINRVPQEPAAMRSAGPIMAARF